MLRCLGCMREYAGQAEACPHCGYAQSTPAKEAYHLPPGTILQGRYIAGKTLGYGGFGVTYIGYDAALERTVAIKEFLPASFATRLPGETTVSVYEGEASTQFGAGLTRFLDEARTLAQFNGIPGIVDIYDSFGGNNTAYIVMQYLRGQDAKSLLAEKGPLPYEEALDIILPVCDTLAAVHQKGIIHRDISPDNIYLTEEGEVKLLDFGAARYESALNSKSLSVILKSGYAPEEQYRSRGEQGPWTDVYALAATFYKLLCGQTPPDSMERAIQDELKEPSKLGATLPPSAENAILNALCVRGADRTQSAAAFKEALLSDGVQRVKVKPQKSGLTRVPLGAKVALGLSVALLLGLGLFAAAGGFAGDSLVIGGTKLQDDYGSATKEGFASVPGLVGKTPEEAKALLEEAGLQYQEGGYVFSLESAESPTVAEQSEPPGLQLALGSPVTLKLYMGELLEAMEKGFLPNYVGQDYLALSQLTANLYGNNFTFDTRGLRTSYVYSSEAELGLVQEIVQKKDEEDGQVYYEALVGAGPKGAPDGYGQLRLAYPQGGNVYYMVSLAENAEEERYPFRVQVLARPVGEGEYQPVYPEQSTVSNTLYTHEPDWPIQFEKGFMIPLMARFPQWEGRTLELRLERRREDGSLIDAIDMEQKLRFSYTEKQPPQVDGMRTLSTEEVRVLVEQEGLDYLNIEDFLQNPGQRKYWGIVEAKGNFPKEDYFISSAGDLGFRSFDAQNQETAHFVNPLEELKEEESWYLSGNNHGEISPYDENGVYEYSGSQPAEVTVPVDFSASDANGELLRERTDSMDLP